MLSSDGTNADELSLRTLAEACRNRAACEPNANLRAWLFAIARDKFHSSRRHEWCKAPLELAGARKTPTHTIGQIWSGDVPVAVGALRSLSDQFREALILVSASGFSYKEAAKICDCPVGTVKSRLFRARQAFVAYFDAMSQLDATRPQA